MTADDLSTKLRWPDRSEPPPPTAPVADPAGTGPGAGPDGVVPINPPEGREPPLSLAGAIVSGEVVDEDERAWRGSGDPFQRSVPSGLVATSTGSRFMMEAYDRLADRVLDRLRSMREGVDEDLTILRSEVASLRSSVEDVADRVQLRKVRTDVYQLRTEVAALRAAVLEWPELEVIAERTEQLLAEVQAQGSTDVSELAEEWVSELATVRDAVVGQPQEIAALVASAVHAALSDVRDDLARLTGTVEASNQRPVVGALAPVIQELATVHEELGALRDEMTSLRRRISLRAEPVASTGLDEAQLGRLADEVAARLLEQVRLPERRG